MTFEHNTVDGVGGSAVALMNELGSWYEGPFPENVILRGNVIRNTQDPPFVIASRSLSGDCSLVKKITIRDNDITVRQGPAIRIDGAEEITIEGNSIQPMNPDDPLENGGVEVTVIRHDRSVKA